MNQELYKNRNVSACFAAAYNLFITNLTKIARHLWMPIVAFSVAYALLLNVRLHLLLHVDELLQDLGEFFALWSGNLLLNLLLLSAVAWIVSALMSRLNSFGLKQNLRRGFVLTGFSLCVAIVCAILFAGVCGAVYLGLSSIAGMSVVSKVVIGIVVLVTLCVMIFFLLPLNFVSMKYFMDGGRLLPSLRAWYHVGMHHVGLLFATVLVAFILFCVLSLVFGMPLYVLTHAQIASIDGLRMGDASILPDGFSWMMGGASLLYGLFMAFFILWNILLNYYVYGSIEQSERERLKTKINKQ